MSGDWQAVQVIAATTEDQEFFPVSDGLSYRIESGQLTIGRNAVCDAYLWLKAPLTAGLMQGDYFSLGMEGVLPLGYFSLRPAN